MKEKMKKEKRKSKWKKKKKKEKEKEEKKKQKKEKEKQKDKEREEERDGEGKEGEEMEMLRTGFIRKNKDNIRCTKDKKKNILRQRMSIALQRENAQCIIGSLFQIFKFHFSFYLLLTADYIIHVLKHMGKAHENDSTPMFSVHSLPFSSF